MPATFKPLLWRPFINASIPVNEEIEVSIRFVSTKDARINISQIELLSKKQIIGLQFTYRIVPANGHAAPPSKPDYINGTPEYSIVDQPLVSGYGVDIVIEEYRFKISTKKFEAEEYHFHIKIEVKSVVTLYRTWLSENYDFFKNLSDEQKERLRKLLEDILTDGSGSTIRTPPPTH